MRALDNVHMAHLATQPEGALAVKVQGGVAFLQDRGDLQDIVSDDEIFDCPI